MDWLKESWLFIQEHHYVEIAFRLFLATILGGLVGLEREQSNRPAGFRTHILVCVGSALIMLISMYGFEEYIREKREYGFVVQDPARLAAQVVSGIGFLGAGTILVHGFAIRGLTTAASLWVVAGIGLALGAGFYFGAVLATFLVLLSLIFLNRLDAAMLKSKNKMYRLVLAVKDQPGKLGEVAALLEEHHVTIRDISLLKGESAEKDVIRLVFRLRMAKSVSMAEILEKLGKVEGIREVKVDQ